MATVTDKPLPLGKPRATAYLAIIEKRDGKRKATAVEKKARELAAEANQRVVRFEFIAQAAGVPLQQMLDELSEQGIRTTAKDVRFGTVEAKAKTNGKPKAETKAASKPASKAGRGNGRKATGKEAPAPKLDETLTAAAGAKRTAKPDPKSKAGTKRGSAKQSASSRKAPARRGRAASSSAPSKTAQQRRQREQKVSAA